MKILIDNFDLIASFILLAVLVGLGCYWAWALTQKDKAEIKEFEDVKLNNKLEDE